ncbi:hypothetical protein COCON_G00201140 [Conger conger]|uniref:Potassium channel tetramerisation-type BTB domain-containing protein n=1 Tax=Conger conger TaxID=82655 RepID=A0A9Q1HRF8_CONCO|nr:hypothetical protein COCON_G00201140 [Conger conger]
MRHYVKVQKGEVCTATTAMIAFHCASQRLNTMELLEEDLTCPICCCLFEDPRVLPCSHSFYVLSCLESLETSKKKSLQQVSKDAEKVTEYFDKLIGTLDQKKNEILSDFETLKLAVMQSYDPEINRLRAVLDEQRRALSIAESFRDSCDPLRFLQQMQEFREKLRVMRETTLPPRSDMDVGSLMKNFDVKSWDSVTLKDVDKLAAPHETSAYGSTSVFVDRDGTLFKYILDYIRTDQVSLPPNFSDFDGLKREAEFYEMHALAEFLGRGGCRPTSEILELRFSVQEMHGFFRLFCSRSSTLETLATRISVYAEQPAINWNCPHQHQKPMIPVPLQRPSHHDVVFQCGTDYSAGDEVAAR